MGGMGKTTLAKMATTTVIRDYARAWVTVGRGFDLKKIGNCILSQLSNKGEHQDSSDVELIMKRLHELLLHGGGGNRLLVVLDDLWPDDSSDLMGCPQGSGKEDRKVIVMVTTRSQRVARGLCADIIHRVDPLNVVDSWHLLERKLGFATRLELKCLLRKIAIKCSSVPLAIHAIGSTLRSKSPEEIRSVLKSHFWKWEEEGGYVLPALLAMSYQCMPPNLRLCFAYCAIFPEGHNIYT